MENKIIVKVTDEDFGEKSKGLHEPMTRTAARGILVNDKGEVALLNKAKMNEYKLAGGGVDEDETPEEAFVREIYEETGCECEILSFLGLAVEEKSKTNFKQTSYVYLAKATKIGEVHFTEKEISEGARLVWAKPKKAHKLISESLKNLKGSPTDPNEQYEQTKFVVVRDSKILDYYIKNYVKTEAKENKKNDTTLVEKTDKKEKTQKNTEKIDKKPQKNEENEKKHKKESKKCFKELRILGYHNLPLACYLFDEVKTPKAAVLVVHGMQEHGMRYENFAKYLNKNGFVVLVSDLRGHGKTMQSKEDYGRGEEDIFTETLKDQLTLIDFLSKNFSLPIYIFGHSYGSMLTQNLLQLSPLIEKAVICGTADGSSSIFKLGSLALSVLAPFKRKDPRNGIEEQLCIKAYGKKFENGNWLTRDEDVFDAYSKDELCGGSFPFSFYYSMIKNMRKTNKRLSKVGNKKVFFIVGGSDPLSSGGKQVKKLCKKYLKNNIDAKIKIYPNARHELINEINKDEVCADIVNFFEE